ncbi:MAG: hypothetical protein ACFB4I_01480 [Cyanophyceae cyanobacterium]
MLLVVLVIVLLLSNWFFADAFVFYPLNIVSYLGVFGRWGLLILGLILLSWCFKD